jgi:1,4-alpha-glucan branching enzyme
LLLGSQFLSPGKPLLFMGGEFAQWSEWNHDTQLEWPLLEKPEHAGIFNFVRDLNRVKREQPALHELDHDPQGLPVDQRRRQSELRPQLDPQRKVTE